MEKALERQLDETMNNPGVVGVLCADKQGLCLGARGTGERQTCGLITSLAETAQKLHPDESSSPVISIETDNMQILIKSKEGITTAVYKSST
ncbi:ragulator complex protein LAMTOR5 homolog [Lingula anatina]|uniref:Late endosomal/lysosomal adaptor and MAPK and MTOR activator 5 n=1 Tax=Lingula anatina TaxID=7574 RepID=A0A1S3ICE7_LINAN|nr:ragulator complex protein LAMTOR5 homolog [Lingula anatina]|eukprot:XP_013395099.1 ragulator complex protein LAMTOR5 homolog [Lingula anatina]